MSQSKSFDIVIVGAGIAGAMMANILAQKTALSIAVVDLYAPKPAWSLDHVAPRVSAINHAATQAFHALGLWETLKAKRVSPYTHMSVWDHASVGQVDFDCSEVQQPFLGHIVENALMQETLLNALQSRPTVTCLWPLKLDSIEEKANGIVLMTKDKQALSARLVIAADGARSWVRTAANIATDSAPYHQTALVATVKTEKPHVKVARQCFMETGPLAFLPLEEPNSHSIVWSCEIEKANRLSAMSDSEFKAALSQAFDFQLGAVVSTSKRVGFPLVMRHVKQYVKPHLALVGDAAHTIHPLAGQGLNIGLMDVIYLAELITQACKKGKPFDSERLLKKYARARRAENAITVKAMGGFKALFGQQNASLILARSHGLRLANKLSVIKHIFIKHAMGLGH